MSSIYRIGDLTLDTGRQELRRGSDLIYLGPLTRRFLLALVEAAPNVVTYDQLAEIVWCGRAVSPETIGQRMKLLRDAIGEDARRPRYVEIVRGQGYRLIAAVSATQADGAGQFHGVRRTAAEAGPQLAALILLLAVGGTLAWWIARPHDPQTAEKAMRPPESGYSTTRIAVLPFDDFSPEGDEQFLADGIAETVLQELTRVEGLEVIARSSSFALRGKDIATVARKLEVGTVLEGSVQRVGHRLRVVAQLVRTADQSNVWSLTFERSTGDIFAIQDEIAGRVADALLTRGLRSDRPRAARTDPEVYDLYLKGRELWQTRDPDAAREAIALLQKAIELDPRFAPAHSELATVLYLFDGAVESAPAELRGRIQGEIDLALRIDPDDAQAYAIRGLMQAGQWHYDEALADLNRAAALLPNDVRIQGWLGTVYRELREHTAAARHLGNAFRLDPMNLFARQAYTEMLIVVSPEDAVAVARQTTRLFPRDLAAWEELGAVYFFQRRHADQILAMAEGLGHVDDPVPLVQEIATTFNRLHDFDTADRWRHRAEELAPGWDPFIHWHLVRGDGASLVKTASRLAGHDPENPVWQGVLAHALIVAGREDEAWAVVSRMLDSIPERARNEVGEAFWDGLTTQLWLARRRGNHDLAAKLYRQGQEVIERRVESGHDRESNMMWIVLEAAGGRTEAAAERLNRPNFLHPNADTYIEHSPLFAAVRNTAGYALFLQRVERHRASELQKLRDAGIPWLFEPENWHPRSRGQPDGSAGSSGGDSDGTGARSSSALRISPRSVVTGGVSGAVSAGATSTLAGASSAVASCAVAAGGGAAAPFDCGSGTAELSPCAPAGASGTSPAVTTGTPSPGAAAASPDAGAGDAGTRPRYSACCRSSASA